MDVYWVIDDDATPGDVDNDMISDVGDIVFVDEIDSGMHIQLVDSVTDVLKKVRKDVKRFRKSPKDNEILQKHVCAHFMNHLKLILDVKTRCSSTFDMVSRYCKLRHQCLLKAFIDLKSKSAVDDADFEIIEGLCSLLEPVKHASDAVCRNNATLLSADSSLEWLVDKLSSDKSLLEPKLHAAVIERIGERRDPTLVALAKYMHKGLISKDFMGIKISKKNMVELADKIFERLELQAHITEEDEEEEEKKETVVKDMKTELQHFIESSLATSDVVPVAKSFDGDFKLYDSQKQRTKKMTLLFNAVLTIKPTSVEAERTFSTSGNFATKIRSRLGDDTLPALVMLKRHFQLFPAAKETIVA